MTRVRELTLVAAAFLAATLVLTLPVVRVATHALPSDTVDTLLNAWIIAWDSDALRRGLAGVWNAPIFYPSHDTLAFSENLLGLAPVVAPVYWVSGNAILTYNVAFLFSFTLAGVGMYLLVRELTGRPLAAMVAGAFYAFCPFRMAQIAHVQMVATGWMPVALWGLHRYAVSRRRRWLFVLIGAWILQTLSNSYVGYFIALPSAFVIAAELWRPSTRAVDTLGAGPSTRAVDTLGAGLSAPAVDTLGAGPSARAVHALGAGTADRRRLAVDLAMACIALAVVLAPVVAAYYRARVDYHQVRDAGEIAALGADVRSYLVGKRSIGVWRWLPTAVDVDPEKELFPGVVVIALAAFALLSGGDAAARRWTRVYGAIAAVAFALSLGPHARVWGHTITRHAPYDWLLRVVPGFDGMRVPARFAIVVFFALSVMAGFAIANVLSRVPHRRGALAAWICALAIVSEGWAAPLPTVRYDPRGRGDDRAVADWLPDDTSGAVLHLPLATVDVRELNCQYATLFDPHPIVNGFSGYIAPLQRLLIHSASPLRDFDRFDGAVRMFRSLGVRYVVVHAADYGAPGLDPADAARTVESLRASTQLVREARIGGATVFELQPWRDPRRDDGGARLVDGREMKLSVSEAPDRLPFLVDGNRDTRWIAGMRGQDGSSEVTAEFSSPIDVARVELQIAERSMIDYPRHIRIDAVNRAGGSRTLYDATPYPELAAAILRDARYPTLELVIPPNDTTRLTVRQTAPTRALWSIHELRIWRRSR